MTKRHVGVGLVVAAVLLAGVALFLWQSGTKQAEDDQLAEDYRAAIDGGAPQDVNPDRAAPLATAGLAAVLFLGGLVVLVVPSPDS